MLITKKHVAQYEICHKGHHGAHGGQNVSPARSLLPICQQNMQALTQTSVLKQQSGVQAAPGLRVGMSYQLCAASTLLFFEIDDANHDHACKETLYGGRVTRHGDAPTHAFSKPTTVPRSLGKFLTLVTKQAVSNQVPPLQVKPAMIRTSQKGVAISLHVPGGNCHTKQI